ncbi:ABC-three component system protein [Streptomyces sp. NPDC059153]|uniref:ABC-three component system protein n=1 Tax=Streptomyces sp. NPDC059153 TaxID=3346743 RepID=UPI0036C1393E
MLSKNDKSECGNGQPLRAPVNEPPCRPAPLPESGAFQVVPEYEHLKDRADQVSRRIKQLAPENVIDRHNLEELQAAVAETTDIEVDHLEPVYRELGIALDDQVRRQFEDVKTSITQWAVSRRFLDEEIADLTERLRSRRSERARLGEGQARLLRDFAEGGTPEALTSVQTTLGREEAALQRSASPLRSGTDLRSQCPADHRESMELRQAVDIDLQERRRQTAEAILLFSHYAQRPSARGRPPSHSQVEPCD